MRRARRGRSPAAVAVAVAVTAAVPLLGGCGIQETDVIEAGGPASFQAFVNRDFDILLFFRSPDGAVIPVIRTPTATPLFPGGRYVIEGSEDTDTAEPLSTEEVVAALLAGLGKEDRAAGLSTSLPAADPAGTIEVTPTSDGRVTVRVPLALRSLNSTALRQLTCTIAYSQNATGQAVVELTGQDGASTSGTCGLAPGSTGPGTPTRTPSPSGG